MALVALLYGHRLLAECVFQVNFFQPHPILRPLPSQHCCENKRFSSLQSQTLKATSTNKYVLQEDRIHGNETRDWSLHRVDENDLPTSPFQMNLGRVHQTFWHSILC